MNAPVDPTEVRALIVSHLDNAGIARVKMLPADKIASAGVKGTTISLSVGMLFSVDDHVNSTAALDATVGDLRGIPDMSALAMLDAGSGLAWAPTDLYGLDGLPHASCQRSALRRVTASAAEAGLEVVVGFEMEFTLFRGTPAEPVLAHVGPGYSTRVLLEHEAWHLDTLTALAQAGVPVEQLHPEYGDGQFELSLAPRSPVRAVDDYLLARVVITRTALAHGYLVSFAPVPVVGSVANGCHIHLSALHEGRNVFFDSHSDSGMDVLGERMTAGILARLDEGIALHGGSVLSFERLRPHNWAGAYVCWGPGNREAAVRYMAGYAGYGAQQSNIEVKCPDPAANHYLSVTALIASALEGVSQELPLPQAVLVEPGLLSEDSLAEAGGRLFPQDLGAALVMLDGSAFFRGVFGDLAVDAYLATRRHEWEVYGTVDPEVVAAAVRFRY
jgi:glutamine synthetase